MVTDTMAEAFEQGRRTNTNLLDRDTGASLILVHSDDLDEVVIADAKPGTDGGTKRHYGNRARVGELATDYRVLGAIGQYDEALRYERLGGTHEFFGVRVEQLAVANDFQLNPVSVERLTCEFGGEYGILRSMTAGGVGQAKLKAMGII